MHHADIAYAFLVKAYFLTPSGALFSEPDTVCFDLDLALEIAESDRAYAAGLAVYALDHQGAPLSGRPLVSHGLRIPAEGVQAYPLPGALHPSGNRSLVC